jgi:cystathionine gamma-synthase
VSLPTWKANVAYEEGEPWIARKMKCGYPRFFVHPISQNLAQEIVRRHGNPENETATLFPSAKTASVCYSFIASKIPADDARKVRVVNLVPSSRTESESSAITSALSCVIYPKEYAPLAKQVWQHTGNGVSSRRAEFCLGALEDGFIVQEGPTAAADAAPQRPFKGPRRYRGKDSVNGVSRGITTNAAMPDKSSAADGGQEGREYSQFIEERFGRNLSTSLAGQAKLAVRRRIAGVLTADTELSDALEKTSDEGRVTGLTDDDVYLFPSGMSAIFNTHQALLSEREPLRSICFGFPYIDTLKVLEKWGPGCLFYGHGSSEDLDDLEQRLKNGERFLSLVTEVPGNPLLKTPDLKRIRSLADQYDFAVVVDETVGTFFNINVLPYSDIVVSSLTKVFSGDSNVMAGSAVINPHGRSYSALKKAFAREYEDNLWAEDAVFLERNSRNFISRIEKINNGTEAITGLLRESPLGEFRLRGSMNPLLTVVTVKAVYYPKFSPTRPLYDAVRNPNGGYGGLFSVTFHSTPEAMAFFDNLEALKGPSLGTNFTLR